MFFLVDKCKTVRAWARSKQNLTGLDQDVTLPMRDIWVIKTPRIKALIFLSRWDHKPIIAALRQPHTHTPHDYHIYTWWWWAWVIFDTICDTTHIRQEQSTPSMWDMQVIKKNSLK